MIRGTDPKTGKVEVLNSRQIKQEILNLTGWDSAEYNKNYAIYRNKLRNYETIIDSSTGRKINEFMLSYMRRISYGQEPTGFQKGVLQITSAANIKIKALGDSIPPRQRKIALEGILADFEQFITKAHDDKGIPISTVLENWLSETVKTEKTIDPDTGEILDSPVERREVVLPRELQKFLADYAKKLHIRQAKILNANPGMKRKDVGS